MGFNVSYIVNKLLPVQVVKNDPEFLVIKDNVDVPQNTEVTLFERRGKFNLDSVTVATNHEFMRFMVYFYVNGVWTQFPNIQPGGVSTYFRPAEIIALASSEWKVLMHDRDASKFKYKFGLAPKYFDGGIRIVAFNSQAATYKISLVASGTGGTP